MRDRVATLYLSLVMVLSVIFASSPIYEFIPTASAGNPDDIATIDVEAESDFLATNYETNIIIGLYDSSSIGIEGIPESIILSDDGPGSNPDGWFSQVMEIGGGLYNTTFYAPHTADPNVVINVSNTNNSVFGIEELTLVNSKTQVSIQSGLLQIDDEPFYIQGLSYAPTYNGSDKYDNGAVQFDIPKIVEANVNTIRLYVANTYYWGGQPWTDAITATDVILDYADIYDLKVIVGFWADHTIDWTDTEVKNNQTAAWEEMVLRYMNAAPVLLWALGNEVLNQMDSANKTSYLQWMEERTQWTHVNDPDHPVTYSSAGIGELVNLKNNVPSLDIFSFNHYDFENAVQFQSVLDTLYSQWPIPVFLNEYGSDSRDNNTDSENETLHATRLQTLYEAVESESRDYEPGFLGSLWFEWTDQWNFEGSNDVQDPGTWWGWSPISCFDGYADLEYFGIASCENYGESALRTLKEAYYKIKELYNRSHTIRIPLNEGWNLISIPLDIGDESLLTVLQSIDSMYDAVQYYDAFDPVDHWKHYTTFKPAYLNDLSLINKTMGFWVHITQPGGANLTIRERKIVEDQEIVLNKGWNLVGYPSTYPQTKKVITAGLEGPITIMGAGPPSDPHLHRFIEDNETLNPNSGYWIHSPIAQIMTIISSMENNPFFTTSGSILKLNGSTVRLVGANSYGILSGYLGIGYVTNAVENSTQRFEDAYDYDIRFMRFWLDVAPSDYWFGEMWTQWTTPSDHSTYFAAMDDLIADAKANDIYIVPSFASAYDQWTAHGGGENFWTVGSATNILFKEWVSAIVTRYADEPQIAFWELGNEANYFSKFGSSQAIQAEVIIWAQDLYNYIKSLDTNHLVEGGWNNMGNMNMADFDALNNFLDVSSHHIYDKDLYAYEDGLGITDPREAVDDYVRRFTEYSHDTLNMPILFGEFNANLTADPEDPFVRWLLESCYNYSADMALIWSWEEGYTSNDDYLVTPTFRPVIAQDISFWSQKFQE